MDNKKRRTFAQGAALPRYDMGLSRSIIIKTAEFFCPVPLFWVEKNHAYLRGNLKCSYKSGLLFGNMMIVAVDEVVNIGLFGLRLVVADF